ncbi:MAG TPA: hypothetical protein VEZ11_18730, partial [Thermoanaerobaculia bacterium]|nr:hypothetical protein [Thermoanaerobaculia bacterium]
MNHDQQTGRRILAEIDSLIAPLVLFAALYLAALLGAGALARLGEGGYGQCVALASVVIATIGAIAICEKGRWPLGLATRPPWRAILELAGGAL